MSHSLQTDQAHCTPIDKLAEEFTSRGLAVLSPDQLGIPLSVHREVYDQEVAALKNGEPITPDSIAAMSTVMSAPGLSAAIEKIIGEDWAVVPYTHNAPFCSGAMDQQWHKDDNGPYNARKMRHHHSVQLEMLYYPQDVLPEMGPTATIPYAHYWTFNSETNHDNFAGADHLDFDYLLSGMESIPVSGPDSENTVVDIQSKNTAHDKRMRDNVAKLKWPLVQPFEATPLRAGSVLLYSHNTFHRGNHRRDDWRTWEDNPRFMWRFYLYRTKDATPATQKKTQKKINWSGSGKDPLTGSDLSCVDENLTSIWRHQYHHLLHGEPAPTRPAYVHASAELRETAAIKLFKQIQEKHDQGEPLRIGAAYQLASLGDPELSLRYLERALLFERENVRRAATYGLSAMGAAAVPLCLRLAQSERKWVRKAALFVLGEVAVLDDAVLSALGFALQNDISVAVRSVAAGSLGCVGRRTAAREQSSNLMPQLMQALLSSLDKEENRLCMSRAQGRSIKFVRPTDDCDVCEGNGHHFGIAGYEPVRSSVRENILWSMVILASQDPRLCADQLAPCIDVLKDIVQCDKSIISVGFAIDALNRLAHLPTAEESVEEIIQLRQEIDALIAVLPKACSESLVRARPRLASAT